MIAQANSRYIPLADNSVHTCVTSPPYWALRSYLADDDPLKPYELGLEPTLDEFIHKMVLVFREVWRVLRPDGTCWVNLGDSFSTASNGRSAAATKATGNDDRTFRDKPFSTVGNGLKAKDLCMVPARVALALQADGWYLRSEIVWHKPNPMPESVTDRPTKAHEMVYLLTKRPAYYYDAEAVRVALADESWGRMERKENLIERTGAGTLGKQIQNGVEQSHGYAGLALARNGKTGYNPAGRNLRSVWTIATEPYPAAHYATFPTKLVEPCILAGTSARGCCPKCGAGWVRVVEKSVSFESGSGKAGNKPVGKYNGTAQAESGSYDIRMGPVTHSTTTGWRPGCSCYRTKNKIKRHRQNLTGSWLDRVAGNKTAPTAPAVVLDPFCGSGTTGYVAHQLGRRFVGLDLSPVYLAENALPRAEKKTSQKAIEELPLFKLEAQ